MVSLEPCTTSSKTRFWLRETHRFMWSSAHQTPSCSRLLVHNWSKQIENVFGETNLIVRVNICTHLHAELSCIQLEAKAKSSDSMTDFILRRQDSNSDILHVGLRTRRDELSVEDEAVDVTGSRGKERNSFICPVGRKGRVKTFNQSLNGPGHVWSAEHFE